MAWFSGWRKRVKVTTDSSVIDANLAHFPVTIFLNSSSGKTSTDTTEVFDELGCDANRYKIAVTKSDGTTEVYVEIEKWDDANEQAILNVSKSDFTLQSAGEDLYVYYDSSHADNTTMVGDVGSIPAKLVWDANFILVNHLSDLGTVSQSVTSDILKVSVSPLLHEFYGLGYPVTYIVDIPADLNSGAKAYHRHRATDSWTQLTGKESTDANTPTTVYNGIECARWDYSNDLAYISVSFDAVSDDIYVKVTDSGDSTQVITWSAAAQRYDNRKAGVFLTADDYDADDGDHESDYVTLAQGRGVWVTLGLDETNDFAGARWTQIQGYIDGGYVEVANHGLNHLHDDDVETTSTYFNELDNSYIFAGLTLPSPYTKGAHEYVWCFIQPYGDWDSEKALEECGHHKYIISRLAGLHSVFWDPWDVDWGGYTKGVRKWIENETIEDLKADFDTATNTYNGFAHFAAHPIDMADEDFEAGGKYIELLNYIQPSLHLDNWYVGFGAAYAYHIVEEMVNGDVTDIRRHPDSNIYFRDLLKQATGAPVEGTGKIGKGQDFDGADDYLELKDSALMRLTTVGTIELWIEPDTTSQDDYAGFVAKTEGSAAAEISYLFNWQNTSDQIKGMICDGADVDSILVTDAAVDTSWQHMAFLWDASDLYLYRNGASMVAAVTQDRNAQAVATQDIRIGGYTYDSDGETSQYFDGVFDEVRISNTARAAAWIKASYYTQGDALLTLGGEERVGARHGSINFQDPGIA